MSNELLFLQREYEVCGGPCHLLSLAQIPKEQQSTSWKDASSFLVGSLFRLPALRSRLMDELNWILIFITSCKAMLWEFLRSSHRKGLEALSLAKIWFGAFFSFWLKSNVQRQYWLCFAWTCSTASVIFLLSVTIVLGILAQFQK